MIVERAECPGWLSNTSLVADRQKLGLWQFVCGYRVDADGRGLEDDAHSEVTIVDVFA